MRIFNDVAIPCFLFSFLYANTNRKRPNATKRRELVLVLQTTHTLFRNAQK